MSPEPRIGYDYAHAIVDDHSRLAYVELHPDEKAATVTGFVERALVFDALPHWLDHYNRTRRHSPIADRPPISRVHNLRG